MRRLFSLLRFRPLMILWSVFFCFLFVLSFLITHFISFFFFLKYISIKIYEYHKGKLFYIESPEQFERAISSILGSGVQGFLEQAKFSDADIAHLTKKYPERTNFQINQLTMTDLNELRLRGKETILFRQIRFWFTIRYPDQSALNYFAGNLKTHGWLVDHPMRAMAIGLDSTVLI